jgi:hypothetical protein
MTTAENGMTQDDAEVRSALLGLRSSVLDTLSKEQLSRLSAHLRRIADYAEARAWVLGADRYGPPKIDEEKERRADKILRECGLAAEPSPVRRPDPQTSPGE